MAVDESKARLQHVRGKTAFVTGGASGIGLGIAIALAQAGASVAIADVDAQALDAALAQLREFGTPVHALPLDVRDRAGWSAAADEAESKLGAVQILCNNAGVTGYSPIVENDEANWDWILAVNLTGPFNGVRVFGPRMIARGQGGHIVNTASTAGLYGFLSGTVGAYSASKFGLVGMSEALRRELAPHGIGVSILCPGLVSTRIGANVMKLRPDRPAEVQPLMPLQQALRDRAARYGMSPLKVGQRVLQAILADEMFVITHPEFGEFVEARHRQLMAHFGAPADPDLPLDPHWRESA